MPGHAHTKWRSWPNAPKETQIAEVKMVLENPQPAASAEHVFVLAFVWEGLQVISECSPQLLFGKSVKVLFLVWATCEEFVPSEMRGGLVSEKLGNVSGYGRKEMGSECGVRARRNGSRMRSP